MSNKIFTADELRAENARLREALMDATAHLAGAASAYRAHAFRSKHLGKATADALFSTRTADFDRAVERARAALSSSAAAPTPEAPDPLAGWEFDPHTHGDKLVRTPVAQQ